MKMRTCRYVKVKFNWLWQTFPMEHNYCAMAEKKLNFRSCHVLARFETTAKLSLRISYHFFVCNSRCMHVSWKCKNLYSTIWKCKLQNYYLITEFRCEENWKIKQTKHFVGTQVYFYNYRKVKLSFRITQNKHMRSGI